MPFEVSLLKDLALAPDFSVFLVALTNPPVLLTSLYQFGTKAQVRHAVLQAELE